MVVSVTFVRFISTFESSRGRQEGRLGAGGRYCSTKTSDVRPVCWCFCLVLFCFDEGGPFRTAVTRRHGLSPPLSPLFFFVSLCLSLEVACTKTRAIFFSSVGPSPATSSVCATLLIVCVIAVWVGYPLTIFTA